MSMQRAFNFEENWTILKNGLDLVVKISQNVVTDKKITPQEWSNLYNIVYTWCTRPEEKKKSELYEGVSKFFDEVVKKEEAALKEKRGDILLKDYLTRFANFTSSTAKIKNIFGYMHRYWIPQQASNGDTSVRSIYDLSLVKWREVGWLPLQARILDAAITQITADRNGDKVDKTLISNLVQAYIQIGIMEEQPVHFYKKEFQDPFIKSSKEYYTKESTEFLQQNNVSAYMKKAEQRLAQEEELANSYLHPTTKAELKRACEEVLIEKHMQVLQDEFQLMLRDDKAEDMKRFYGLLSRIPNGLNNSADTLKKFLTEVGSAIVRDQSKGLNTKAAIKDSISLINALLNLHKKYAGMIKACMSDHKLFVQAMDEAFTVFVNKNVGVFSMAEVLNFYVDNLLKGMEKLAEDQLNERSEQTVRMFTYFDDKDLFSASFRRSLGKRLLSKKFNEDAERNFIALLKRQCGDIFTKKLEGMFNDIKVSDERIPRFKEFCKGLGTPLDVDLNVTVLNESYWGLPKQDLNLAKELIPAQKAFESYYFKETEKRKLMWLYNQGTCAVQYIFLDEKKKKRRCELSVSCVQACIMLLYNDQVNVRFTDLQTALGLTPDALKYSITPLVYSKTRVFANKGPDGKGKAKPAAKKEEDGEKKEKEKEDEEEADEEGPKPKGPVETLEPEDLVGLVPFRSGGRVKIPFPPGVAVQGAMGDHAKIAEKAMEERNLKMDLALVRVMKSRNQLKVQNLIAEATSQLLKFFKPDPKGMKKRIETLMERGFMRRDADDQTLIHYCA